MAKNVRKSIHIPQITGKWTCKLTDASEFKVQVYIHNEKMWWNYQYTRILLQFLLLNESNNSIRQQTLTHKIMQMFTDICSDMHIDNMQKIHKMANILVKQVYSLHWCVQTT